MRSNASIVQYFWFAKASLHRTRNMSAHSLVLLSLMAAVSLAVAQLNYTIDCSTFSPKSTGNTCQDYGSDAAWAPILSRPLPDWCESVLTAHIPDTCCRPAPLHHALGRGVSTLDQHASRVAWLCNHWVPIHFVCVVVGSFVAKPTQEPSAATC
jgi:hypothetical protein